ncbi:hypothetical protein BOO71_0011902 [Deinococcus marmoris]|uniref:Uncharacterized protein n=1 Tax=Deinococcus marmoris TaxID=249408 RepID=A0A1U7NU20_9DEIO|nr:hypothetical protein BOO71_0011902 [Deinococcus marmoris]
MNSHIDLSAVQENKAARSRATLGLQSPHHSQAWSIPLLISGA